MSPRSPAILALTAAAVVGLAGPASHEGDEANWKRIQAMPREQRLNLARALDRFDALPSEERAAVRDLDAAIARLDPALQARYHVVLRRYHVWLGGLDEKQRAQLAAARTASEKLALVGQWRKAEVSADVKGRNNLIFGIHPAELGTIPPFEMANILRVWFALDAREKADVEKNEKMSARLAALRRLAVRKGIATERFPRTREDALIDRLRADGKVNAVFQKWISKREEAAEAESKDPERKANPLHPLAESLYFVQHPPEPVVPARLAQFDAEIPNWLRATLDPLPPDEARRQLTILYRQVYPKGSEIPPPTAKAAPAKADTPAPKPATPPSAPPPF